MEVRIDCVESRSERGYRCKNFKKHSPWGRYGKVCKKKDGETDIQRGSQQHYTTISVVFCLMEKQRLHT